MILSTRQERQIKYWIEASVSAFYANAREQRLIVRQLHERTLVFRIGLVLNQNLRLARQSIQANIALDFEYNKNMAGGKIVPSRPNGCYPDLILHERENNDANVAVIEFKGHWTQVGRITDTNKLIDFSSQHPRARYKYGIGAFIDLYPTYAEITYYINRIAQPVVTVR